jgi:hypothetical protein
MAQLKILTKTRNELRLIKARLAEDSAETMSQIVARLTHAEFMRIGELSMDQEEAVHENHR